MRWDLPHATLEDPRVKWVKEQLLSDSVTIVVGAAICGADHWVKAAAIGSSPNKWDVAFDKEQGCSYRRIKQSCAYGKNRRLCSVGSAKLGKNRADIIFDGAFREKKSDRARPSNTLIVS